MACLEDEAEHQVQERPQGCGVSGRLGPQHGPLPAAQPEVGEVVDVQTRVDLARITALPKPARVPRPPFPKNLIESCPKRLALVGHLLREVADQATVTAPPPFEPLADRLS